MARKQKLLSQSIGHLRVIEQEAVKIAKTYLKQNHDYSLIAKRLTFKNANYITAKEAT